MKKVKYTLFVIIIFICVSTILRGQSKVNRWENEDILFDRYACLDINFPDSGLNYFNSIYSGPKDTIIMIQENPIDTVLIIQKKGKITLIQGFYPLKKVSGDYYELLGFKRTINVKIDTCTLWKNLFTFLKDPNLDKIKSLPSETDPKIKISGVLGSNWLCIQLKTDLKYDNIYDPKSKLVRLFNPYYSLLR
jgi:hypothetical protein